MTTERDSVHRTRRDFLRLAGFASGALIAAACAPAPAPSVPAQTGGAAPAATPAPRRNVRLSIATGGTGGVYFVYGGGIARLIGEHVQGATATAEATNASIDNLRFLGDGNADIAFTQADVLDDAIKGENDFRGNRIPAMSLANLYVNAIQVVTVADRNITRVADLRGRNVSTGAPGSGTEYTANRILETAGVGANFSRQSLGVQPSVDALRDNKIDAFFWSGGLPTAAITDLANTPGRQLRILPLNDIQPILAQRFGPVYVPVTIPQATYPGLTGDVAALGMSNILVVNQRMPEDLAYDITKMLFEQQQALIQIHPEARNLNLQTATTGTSAPFHPGAIRFYRERNAWRG